MKLLCFLAVAAVSALMPGLLEAQSLYAPIERGLNYTVYAKTNLVNGTNRISRYTELASGLNFSNEYGQIVEANESISVLPNGGAQANQGQTKVIFPADIYDGVLQVTTPDGRQLTSRPLGIAVDDGSNTVFIASLTNAVGYLVGSNQVVYRGAFGPLGDLVCRYRRSGFESDAVIRQQLPDLQLLGIDKDAATLQMVTEFFDTADPQEIAAGSDDWYGLVDSTLKFGKLTMGRGKAFATPATNSATASARVYKHWLHVGTRKFLVEEIPLADVAADLNALPQQASIEKPAGKAIKFASNQPHFPASHPVIGDTNHILLASADFKQERGFVLDYTEINGIYGDGYEPPPTFQSGETYYISGPVYCGGTATFFGRAILKFASGACFQDGESASFSADFESTKDEPVVFTAVDDNSIGETIDGSTGTPSGYYGVDGWGGVLVFDSSDNVSIHDLRMFYIGSGIFDVGGSISVTDAQFVNCDQPYFGYYSSGGTFENVLVANANCVVNNCGDSMVFENCTFDNVTTFDTGYGNDEYLTNCLGANVDLSSIGNANYYDINQSYGPYDAHDRFLSSDSALFLGDITGNYYLTPDSPYRGLGTTNIDTGLLAEIETMTTYAPEYGGWPDTSGTDLGYHYSVNEDSDYDGLPDWWELQWFGNLSVNGTTLDSQGRTLLYDYQNGLDPNVVQFSIQATNNYVNTASASLQLVINGSPYYTCALVDDTNLADAVWQSYSGSNITVNLGLTEGWHEILIGMRGFGETPENASWQWKRLKLDFTPPALFITNPVNTTVDIPMIQLQGFSPETLSSISYDLTNAAGLLTNQQVLVLNQFYDTNTFEFTTNTFQAFDVVLTNGVNTFTFHATDLAGNMTTTNYCVTLDYSSKTNPPGIQVTWPQNGTLVSGNSFTVDGYVADATVTVAATITDTNGNANSINGLVERSGKFWLENMPLNGGTNAVRVTATDAAGNVTTTNFNVVQSTVTLTVNPVADSQLWQPTVNVTGTISDTTYAIWVNGVKGRNNGDGTWSASNVPVDSGGTASFTATGYEPNEQQPDGSYGN